MGRLRTVRQPSASPPPSPADEFAAVSGELCTAPGYHRPTTLLNVKNALRIPGTPLVGGEPTLNVACVIGPVLDATAARLRDGTSITVLTVVCQSPQPSQYRNLQTVVLKGAERDLVRTIGSGDTIRADGRWRCTQSGGRPSGASPQPSFACSSAAATMCPSSFARSTAHCNERDDACDSSSPRSRLWHERSRMPFRIRAAPRRISRMSNGDVVAWCAGHILELAPPDAYDPDFKQWRIEHLPITPRDWKLTVTAPDLLKTIKMLLPRASVVVNAGNPNREGQLLVDEVLDFLGYRGRVNRVLVYDLNPPAVRKAIERIESNERFRGLYEAALARQRADWLYGINITRLYTVLGRKQGTKASCRLAASRRPSSASSSGETAEIEASSRRRTTKLSPRSVARRSVLGRVAAGHGSQALSIQKGASSVPRLCGDRLEGPRPAGPGDESDAGAQERASAVSLSLAELQIEAGRRLGLSPKGTLDVCQALYETHRLVTYPRSDCPYLPEGQLSQVDEVSQARTSSSLVSFSSRQAQSSRRSRAWNDTKIPPITRSSQPPEGRRRFCCLPKSVLYNLIARRYLAQFFPPFEYHQLETQLLVAGETLVSKGRAPCMPGWKRVLDAPASAEDAGDDGEEESASGGHTGPRAGSACDRHRDEDGREEDKAPHALHERDPAAGDDRYRQVRLQSQDQATPPGDGRNRNARDAGRDHSDPFRSEVHRAEETPDHLDTHGPCVDRRPPGSRDTARHDGTLGSRASKDSGGPGAAPPVSGSRDLAASGTRHRRARSASHEPSWG